jgi:hypothetical protein
MYGLENVVDMATTLPFTQLKIAIVGAPKTGKSRLAATAPQERFDDAGTKLEQYQGTWFADFDGRLPSLAGIVGVSGKTYQDANPLAPRAFAQFIQDLGMLEYAKQQGKVIPATICCDSVTYMSDCALRYVMSQNSTGTKDIAIGSYKMRIARGYEPYDGEVSFITNSFQRIIELGSNLICCFHDRAEEAPDSTQENPRFTGKVTVHPPRAKKYLALFNELYRVQFDSYGGGYQVQCKANNEFTAGSTLNVAEFETPDIKELIKKHQAFLLSKK